MHISLTDIAAAVGGTIVGDAIDAAGAPVEINGVTQDSRAVEPGCLFVPILAERDGHDFVSAATAAGAGAYLSSRPVSEPGSIPAVVVADTVDALQQLGRLARARIGADVVGITGSAGKTSTKDLVAAALAAERATHASEKSFNNELGVPLTLLNAPDNTEIAVVEMGARGPGHIALLCDIARPTLGVVTTVGNAHTSEFGSFEAVVAGKGELVEALPASGTAVLNAMVPEVAQMAGRTQAQVITFGIDTGDVRAVDVSMNDDLTSQFRIEGELGGFDVSLGARGEHNVANAAAAAAVALSIGVSPESIAAGLANPGWSPWRMEMSTAASGLVVVNDAYNANPLSVSAALTSLGAIPARRRIAVLGVMAELGDAAAHEHRRIAHQAHELGIEIIAVDAPLYDAASNVADRNAALSALGEMGELGDGDAILVKGSRVAGLELLADELLSGG